MQATQTLFDSSLVATPQEALEFIGNILESSTEYSVIAKDLDGTILLWNEGAHRIYGYEAPEVIGKDSAILHVPEDVASGRAKQVLADAVSEGKWEGTIDRLRKNGERFPARVVITPRRDAAGKPVGFLLISKDISSDIRLTEELKSTQFYTRSLMPARSRDLEAAASALAIFAHGRRHRGARRRQRDGSRSKSWNRASCAFFPRDPG